MFRVLAAEEPELRVLNYAPGEDRAPYSGLCGGGVEGGVDIHLHVNTSKMKDMEAQVPSTDQWGSDWSTGRVKGAGAFWDCSGRLVL